VKRHRQTAVNHISTRCRAQRNVLDVFSLWHCSIVAS